MHKGTLSISPIKVPVKISADGCKKAKLPHAGVASSLEPSVAATGHIYQTKKTNCCIPDCNYQRPKAYVGRPVTSFKFPDEKSLRKKWMDAIGLINWKPPKFAYLCSLHFKKVTPYQLIMTRFEFVSTSYWTLTGPD